MPSIIDITQSVQIPQLIKDSFISKGNPLLDGRGNPIHYSGGFAVVFPFEVDGKKWAFRCWSADIGNMEKRLHTLSNSLKQLSLPYFCDFTYELEGIVVNGEVYPTTRMQWIDGKNIKDYICEHKSEPKTLQKIANDFLHMCDALHENKIAHGDLQHGNILVDGSGVIRLIDYDSVYLPALQNEEDIIAGLPDYQHPNRKKNKIATEKLDYFSELIIYLSILAIAENPQLVDKYRVDDADRLLFSKEDFTDIECSDIYKDIRELGKDFQDLLFVLTEYLKCKSIDELVPFETFLLERKITFCSSVTKAVRNTQTVEITWDVPFEAEVSLKRGKNNDIIKCEKKGHISTTLKENATFELFIEKTGGPKIKKELSINVFDECKIEFSADKYHVFPTIPVKLSWKVKNAKKVWLDDEEIQSSGTRVIEPKKATTYILSAEDEFGKKEKQLEIAMLPIPQVKSLLVPTPNIVNNMSVTIKQPKYNVGVKFPQIDIGFITAEVPKIPSLTDLGINVELSPPLPKTSLKSAIKKVYNHIIKK